ncbi:hypothetical protein FRB99_000888 [Tulasnella sp. 403]|nr:hypothetical protein FRB99_000888 [Tulasnella sp. 403]
MSIAPDHHTLRSADEFRPSELRTTSDLSLPQQFAEGDYWKKYYESAQEMDKDTIKRLANDLDILLIFAGLFSGINTAFIAVTLNSLSPGPNDETNMLLRAIAQRPNNVTLTPDELAPPPFSASGDSVRTNCFFIASLSCSTLAAFGAMLGKQWLSNMERVVQGGSLRVQARRRQQQFSSAERWHFSSTVEVLPVALQFALLSFWMGLIDFLLSLHHTVGYVALGFALLGAVGYLYTVVAAAWDPHCPFQTPVTTVFVPRIRQSLIVFKLAGVLILYTLGSATVWLSMWFTLVSAIVIALTCGPFLYIYRHSIFGPNIRHYFTAEFGETLMRKYLGNFLSWVLQPWYKAIVHTAPPSLEQSDKAGEVVDAESVRWFLTTSTEEAVLVEAARNILALRDIEAVRRLTLPSPSYTRLLIQLQERMDRIRRRPKVAGGLDAPDGQQNVTAAIVYMRAVSHVLLTALVPVEWSLGPWGDRYAQDLMSSFDDMYPDPEPSPLDELMMFKLLWGYPETVEPYLKIAARINPELMPLDKNFMTKFCVALSVYSDHVLFFREEEFDEKDILQRLPFRKLYIHLLRHARTLVDPTTKRIEAESTKFKELWPRILVHMQCILCPTEEEYRTLLPNMEGAEAEEEVAIRTETVITMRSLSLARAAMLEDEAVPSSTDLQGDATLDADSRPSAKTLWEIVSLFRGGSPDELSAMLEMMRWASYANQDHHLGLFRSYPTSVPVLVYALIHESPDIRLQALQTMSTFAPEWFDHQQADIHDMFLNAKLGPVLAACAKYRGDESSEPRPPDLLHLVLRNLVHWLEWKVELSKAFRSGLDLMREDDEEQHKFDYTWMALGVWHMVSESASADQAAGDQPLGTELAEWGASAVLAHLILLPTTMLRHLTTSDVTAVPLPLRAYSEYLWGSLPPGSEQWLLEYQQLERAVAAKVEAAHTVDLSSTP